MIDIIAISYTLITVVVIGGFYCFGLISEFDDMPDVVLGWIIAIFWPVSSIVYALIKAFLFVHNMLLDIFDQQGEQL